MGAKWINSIIYCRFTIKVHDPTQMTQCNPVHFTSTSCVNKFYNIKQFVPFILFLNGQKITSGVN